mmetsp:Transcript_43834/g.104181  ORF Transcript_43834/g.104181 Transcript_43834/m.104181 type:complete len:221 (-) Transcript_43834:136-798(-)
MGLFQGLYSRDFDEFRVRVGDGGQARGSKVRVHGDHAALVSRHRVLGSLGVAGSLEGVELHEESGSLCFQLEGVRRRLVCEGRVGIQVAPPRCAQQALRKRLQNLVLPKKFGGVGAPWAGKKALDTFEIPILNLFPRLPKLPYNLHHNDRIEGDSRRRGLEGGGFLSGTDDPGHREQQRNGQQHHQTPPAQARRGPGLHAGEACRRSPEACSSAPAEGYM